MFIATSRFPRSCLSNRRCLSSFSFSACGWLTPFHIGAIKAFKNHDILSENSVCTGASGGSIAALVACLDIPCDSVIDNIIRCSTDPSFTSNIDLGIKKTLQEILSPNAKQFCDNRLLIAVTKVENYRLKHIIVSKFDNNDHLIDTIAASCFIPIYSSPRLSTSISSESSKFMDGGFLCFLPPYGNIRVSPFPAKYFPASKLKPDICLSVGEYSLPTLLKWSLKPPVDTPDLMNLYSLGYEHTSKWIAHRSAKNRF